VPYRPERLAELIKKEVSRILRDELKDPRIGFATVTSVEVSADLRHVKIYVSVYGSEEERQATMAALQRAQSFVRNELGRCIRVRHTPEIIFKLDESIDHGMKVMRLLEKIKKEENGLENE